MSTETRRAFTCAVALVCGLVFACAPSPTSGVREQLCGGSGCASDCRDISVDVCDIRDASCQDQIFRSVRCVRGSSLATLPRTTFVPQSQLGGTLDERDAGTTGEQPSPPQVAQQVWADAIDEGLQLLHLIATPLSQAQENEKQVTGGVTTGNSISIAENNADYEWRSMRLLAHEYVHTMQEHDYGGLASLYARYSRSSVTAQGIQAFIEGEAELYSWLTHAFMRNTEIEGWSLEGYFEVEKKGKRDHVVAATSPWTSARQWQHYAVGAGYLFGAWKRGHNLGVRSVMYNLEPDFGKWVVGFAPRNGPEVARDPICSPEGNQVIVQDSLGPSGVFAILVAASKARRLAVVPSERAWQLATQLSSDQLRVYAPTLDGNDTQTAWLEREAASAMCRPQKPAVHVGGTSGVDAGEGDGGKDGGAHGGDFLDAHSCHLDAGALPSNAAAVVVTEETPFEVLQQRLVPGAPVWVSWELGFETSNSAQEFEDWITATGWATVSAERRSSAVLLRARRTPTTDAEKAALGAWTCR